MLPIITIKWETGELTEKRYELALQRKKRLDKIKNVKEANIQKLHIKHLRLKQR